MRVKDALVSAGDLFEMGVFPDDLAGVQTENDHGQREMHDGILGSIVDLEGQRIDIFADAVAAAAGFTLVENKDQQDHDTLNGSHGDRKIDRDTDKEDQHGKYRFKSGFQEFCQLFIHKLSLLT